MHIDLPPPSPISLVIQCVLAPDGGYPLKLQSLPYSAQLIAVEMGGEPLETFEHPKRAVYVLGSEDNGIPDSMLRMCHARVTLPCVR